MHFSVPFTRKEKKVDTVHRRPMTRGSLPCCLASWSLASLATEEWEGKKKSETEQQKTICRVPALLQDKKRFGRKRGKFIFIGQFNGFWVFPSMHYLSILLCVPLTNAEPEIRYQEKESVGKGSQKALTGEWACATVKKRKVITLWATGTQPSGELWQTVQNTPELSQLRIKEAVVYMHWFPICFQLLEKPLFYFQLPYW